MLQHKLIFYYGCDMNGGNQTPPGWELYDLQKDPHEVCNVYEDPAYLLSGDPPPVKPHAFHSPENAEAPFVVVRLDEVRQIRYLKLVNRSNGFHDRAEGLTVWVSDDESNWRQVWQADRVAPEWTVHVRQGLSCRYLKIGLPDDGTLHLKQVIVFGK